MRYSTFFIFLVLLAGSFIFAQERILFCDASFILTEILNDGSLHIQEHRYGAFITQIVPLLAGKAHLPLKDIILLYSISFNLFYLIVASIIIFKFRNVRLTVLMAFYYTLFASDTYFWANNEIHQAMAWMFLLFGMVLNFKRQHSFLIHLPVFLFLCFLSVFTHPIIVIIFPFMWFYFFLEKEKWPYSKNETITLSLLILIICVIKYCLMLYAGYDSHKVRSATHFSLTDIIASFSSNMMKSMAIKLITNYFFVPVLFFVGIISAVRAGKKKHVWLVVIFTLVYVLMTSLTFPSFIAFYIESEWMPLSIIATILFVYQTLPKIKPGVAIALLSIIFLVRIGYIVQASEKFTERKEWIFATLDKMKNKRITKGYVYRNEKVDKLLLMNWGVPTESLIASSLRGDKPVLTFIVDRPENIKNRLPDSEQEMISCFQSWNNNTLNHYYFQVDTTARYQLVELQATN
jgi:hypothetical protein